ncbi:hypothetical protein ITP53_04940 [Nonomuraea sp. K274]|uniref:Uncharacterized protein n=1 Tax=Nonomuraea cypriaca TaxID=1187855 RepID=A0A931A822_9ACTN|nr:hypothetical protein [Nonomuraea cypriaca]MBF8185095.1 hypothetical protein [Nonomuraea cypriaca]
MHRSSVQRVRTVSERPGGKAVNVGRVLHQLGEKVPRRAAPSFPRLHTG